MGGRSCAHDQEPPAGKVRQLSVPSLEGSKGTDKINVFSIENTCMGLKRKK